MDSALIRNNFQLFCILALWFIVGAYMGPVYLGFITLFVFLMKLNGRDADIFIGFLFVLILSDSLENAAGFAKTYKTIYVMLLFLFFVLDTRNRDYYAVNTYMLFIPYFIMGVVGLFYSPAPVIGTSVQKLLSYVLLFMAVPGYVVNCYRQYGRDFFRSLLYFMFFIIVLGILLKFVWPGIVVSHGGRLRGIFGNPNGLGIFLILMYLLFIILTNQFQGLMTRAEKLVFSLVMLYAVIESGSRTALMAILLFHLFTFVFRRSRFLGFFLFFIALFLVEGFVVYFPRIIIALDLQESFRLDTLQEGSGRTVAWAFAWENIKQSVLVGKGFAYDEYLMRSNFELLSKMGHQGGVHNTYLIMWLNTGLIGLLFFLRGMFLLFIRSAKRSPFAFPAMFAIMLSISFEPWLAASLNPFTILFLIITTVMSERIFYEEETENPEDETEENTQLA